MTYGPPKTWVYDFSNPATAKLYRSPRSALYAAALAYFGEFPHYGPFVALQDLEGVANTDHGYGPTQYRAWANGTPREANNWSGYGTTVYASAIDEPPGAQYEPDITPESAALPQIQIPRGLPCWLAADHGMEPESVYADTAMRTGHARKRRIYTTAPKRHRVALFLDTGQSATFWHWYENRLRGGQEAFSTRVANQGPGYLWYGARFAEPPVYESMAKERFRVTAMLLLLPGMGGTEAGPVEDAAIGAQSVAALIGSVALDVPKRLAALSVVALEAASRLAAISTVALDGIVRVTPAVRIAALSSVALDGSVVFAVGSTLSALSLVALQERVTFAALSSVALEEPPRDPYAANVRLLFHFDGPEGSETFTDERGHSASGADSAPFITTAYSKFGGASLDPGGFFVEVPHSADISVGTQDFTAEGWLRIASHNTGISTALFGSENGTATPGRWFLAAGTSSSATRLALYYNGSAFIQSADGVLPLASWVHVAVSRSAGVTRLFADGVQVASGSDANDYSPAIPFRIGGSRSGTASLQGNLDDVRLTIGVGRYTGDFAPPTAPFPNL